MTGFDDLTASAPTTPDGAHPGWRSNRARVLDDILAEQPQRGGRRWIAGLAAAAILVAAVAVGIQLSRPDQVAIPADPTTSAPAGPQLVGAAGTLLGAGEEIGLCRGAVMESYPPQCETIPIEGLTWADVPWADEANGVSWGEATIVGTFDGTTFHVTDAYAEGEAGTPSPLNEHAPLCETPTDGTGDQAGAAGLEAIAKRYPGYVGLWVSPDQATFNLAFTDGGEEAAVALAAEGSEPFCVGRVDGITAAEAAAAMPALGEMMQSAGITYYGHTFGTPGSRLDVGVIRESPEVRRAIESAIGPTAAEHLRIVALIHPTEG